MKTIIFIQKDYIEKSEIAECYLNNLSLRLKEKFISIPGLINSFNIFDFKKISSLNQIPILCKDRDRLVKFLISKNIDIAPQHIRNLTNLEIYSKYVDTICNKAEKVSQELLLLPCYPGFSKESAKRISYLINQFYTAHYR